MKNFYFYMDDQSNSWMVMREEDAPELTGDAVGPTGLPAITVSEQSPVDECLITFRSAHRITDFVTKRTAGKTFYFLQIGSVADESEYVLSKQAYKWPDVIKLAEIFQGISYEKAKKLVVSRGY